ncbi:D-alanine--D-alanine ligase family protein [Schumannella luteola]|uniref:D-alanine--D-alanine ligase n=1 Tax=Schumannella luteola TaxID=472059 RepID=A0A852YC48_9MICO|nr:D-alanine--D-alanine ligase family protein [Schumannella luteola]NYG98910.1 D-alanine-D-alanine ligase [Schumannella luteola]TPX06288.1 D-alanine--D-alanine ligase [Schumannella luteola]
MTTRIALIFGGRSSEHQISCATAGGVLGAIDRDAYEVVPIGITRDGAWTLQPDDASRFRLADLPEVADDGSRVHLPASASTREWTVTRPDGTIESLGEIDVAFPLLHGPFGEDGTLQGALELVGVPYVGNGVLASALGMDKHFTKTVLQGAGVEVAPWVTVTQAEWARDRELWERRMHGLALPAFVKPARAGSSVGVSRVTDWAELDAALETAFREDSRVLVESGIVGRELECAVLSGRDGGPTRVSVAGEIVITGREFYDFEAKYLDAPGIDLVCPAELGEQELAEMQRIAARAFDAIGGSGLARVDFFFTGTEFVINEINTMPGFTPISMFPACWQATGLSYPELITELIELGRTAVR